MILPRTRVAALLAAFAFGSQGLSQEPLPPPTKQLDPLPPPDKTDPKAEPKVEPGMKVLDRGPVHEAFAQPGAEVRGQGMTAPKAPPPQVPEVPPDTKPDGPNVRWIPGYWSWDNDRNDFIWVSGFWRNAPSGREWSAGRWKEVDGKWTYLPGSWRPTDMNSWRIDLPQPPASLENGPSTPADNPNGLWIPGAWEFRNEKYVWRPGYWANPNGNNMWVPSQYLTTPYGYMYIPGYWDYPLEDRGILNAPVQFSQPLWNNPGWSYCPQYAIGLGYGSGWGNGGLFSSLYIGPGCNNYYYGNYGWGGLGGGWLGIGFGYGYPFWGLGGWGGYYPWYGGYRGYYNPLWHHYCYLNRNNPNYTRHVGNVYAGHAMGVRHPGATHVTPTHPTAIGGAAHTAIRSATATVHPVNGHPMHVGTGGHSLVQPSTQVARSVAASHAAHGLTTNGVHHVGNGITIAPHTGVTHASPLHVGSGVVGTHPTINGVHSGVVTHPGTYHPSGVVTHPGTYHPNGTVIHPGTMYHPNGTMYHPGTAYRPGTVYHPGVTGGFHSAPTFHSGGFHSAPSFHGGHVGGGHMGGGHMGGGHHR